MQKMLLIMLSLVVIYFHSVAQESSPQPNPDIIRVVNAHSKELMAIPDVVSVSITRTEDGRTFDIHGRRLCISVGLARENPESEQKIPRMIEGYPVITKVTGKILPLGK
jgi:hypothetical protein